jgi:hypothetical protein
MDITSSDRTTPSSLSFSPPPPPFLQHKKKNNKTREQVDTTEDALADIVSENQVSVLPAFHFLKNGKPFAKEVIGYKKTPLKEAVAALAKA